MVLIILVISLSVFAILALRSAYAEKKLADKTAEAVERFYGLESAAQEALAKVGNEIDTTGNAVDTLKKIRGIDFVTDTYIENGKFVVTMYVKADDDSPMAISAKAVFDYDSSDITEWRYIREEVPGGYGLVLPD